MFRALMTPRVAKTVNGTARIPSCSSSPPGVIDPRSFRTTPAPKIISRAASTWATKRTAGRQLEEVVDHADGHQQEAGAEEAVDLPLAQRNGPVLAQEESEHESGEDRQAADQRRRGPVALPLIGDVHEAHANGHGTQQDDQEDRRDEGNQRVRTLGP